MFDNLNKLILATASAFTETEKDQSDQIDWLSSASIFLTPIEQGGRPPVTKRRPRLDRSVSTGWKRHQPHLEKAAGFRAD
jgi:hypothetical protein